MDSKYRLDDVRAALAQTREEGTTLKVRLQIQKERIARINALKLEIDEINTKIEKYEKPGQLKVHTAPRPSTLDHQPKPRP